MHKKQLAVALLGAFSALGAHAGTYVLQAPKWGAAQQAAVALAGGSIRYAHGEAGIAVVDSDNPAFLQAVRGVITSGAPDRVVQWTQPTPVVALPAAVDPTNDTYFSGVQWAPQSVEAPAAWSLGYTGNGVRVAVIDGGIYAAHADLAGAVDVAASRSFVAPDPDASALENVCRLSFNCDLGTFWHGTHVAGIVAARDNTRGVVGIAPEATIVGAKALHGGSGDFGGVIGAILHAATPVAAGGGGADIINMSLGAVFPKRDAGAAELISALNRAVNYAAARGVLVVASAGNDEFNFDFSRDYIVTPAESGNAIAISATGPYGFGYGATDFRRPASYSNYGNSLVWVSAPGGDFAHPSEDICIKPVVGGAIGVPCWAYDMVLSTSRGTSALGGYTWAAGTSMSAPAASAVAALIKQRFPGATPAQLKTRLAKSADDEGPVGQDNFHGRGFVNARRAVTE